MTYALAVLALAGAVGMADTARISLAVIRARRAARRFEADFWAGADLAKLYATTEAQQPHPMAAVFLAAMTEWRRSAEAGAPGAGTAARADRLGRLAAQRAVDGLAAGMWRLAAITAAAPLAGIAVGIMEQAPSPAAAGLALGTLAAVAHHAATAMVAGLRSQLDGFATDLAAIMQRQAQAGAGVRA